MKIFTLSIAMLLLSALAFSQTNPCPDIVLYNFGLISSNGPNCTSTIKVTANGIGVSSQKGMKIEVYENSVTPANLIRTDCFTVPGQSANAVYETGEFTLPCSTSITYVITRTTASNGTCSGGTCSGSTVITVNGGPLPIRLSSFYAKRNGNAVNVIWTTETEINAKEFIIERNSGSGFTAVGTVAAINNGSGSSYTYQDNNNVKTVSQYRLKMVDKDASFKLSEIRAVKGTAAVSDFTIFPNPSAGNAKVSITDITQATTVELIDNAGRTVKSIELQNKNSVELNSLQNGIYLVRIINKKTGDAATKKLTVKN